MSVKFSAVNLGRNSALPQPPMERANLPGDQPAEPAPPSSESVPARPRQRSIPRLNLDLSQLPSDALSRLPAELQSKVASHLPARDLRAMWLTTQRPSDVLSQLPSEVQKQVSGYLPARDLGAIALTNKTLNSETADRQTSLKLAHEVSQVTTRAGFLDSIQAINDLPSNLRTAPLHNAMLRIHALPLTNRPQALGVLRQAVNQQAAEHRPPELPKLGSILSHENAVTAVRAGEDVAVVATAFGTTTEALNELLTRPDPGAALRAGENVMAVAARFGIPLPKDLVRLPLQREPRFRQGE